MLCHKRLLSFLIPLTYVKSKKLPVNSTKNIQSLSTKICFFYLTRVMGAFGAPRSVLLAPVYNKTEKCPGLKLSDTETRVTFSIQVVLQFHESNHKVPFTTWNSIYCIEFHLLHGIPFTTWNPIYYMEFPFTTWKRVV